LHHDRIFKQFLVVEPLGQQQVPCIEDLDFRTHAKRLDLRRHSLEHGWRVGHDIVAFAEIHGAAIKRANLGAKLCHVFQAFGCARHISAVERRRHWLFHAAEREIAAHACGKVQHHIDAGRLDVLDNLGVERDVARTLASFRVADVNMSDRSAGIGGGDALIGDLARRDRDLVGPACRIARAGHGAGDEYFAVGGKSHLRAFLA
jgi:hypothetical protein